MKINLFIGSSGWTYADWVGLFYPKEVASKDRLKYYAERFNTLEINSTFYHLPRESTIKNWDDILGKDFRLVIKGSKIVTHLKKLRGCKEDLELFFSRVKKLKSLRVIFD